MRTQTAPASGPYPESGLNVTNARRWTIVGLLFTASLINYFDRATLSFALPIIADDFKLDPAQKGFLSSAFFWSYALMQVPMGLLADRVNLRWLYAGAFTLWSIAQGLTGFAGSLMTLMVFRVILGVGEAIYLPGGTKVASLFFALSERGLPCGLFDFGTRTGLVLEGVLVPWLVDHYGWRTTFAVVGFTALLWLVPWLAITPRRLQGPSNQVTGLSGLSLVKGFAALAAHNPKFVSAVVGCLLGGFLGFFLRPAAGINGQLSFLTVISRGADLSDAVLISTARASFNYLVGGVSIGAMSGLVGASALLARLSRKAPDRAALREARTRYRDLFGLCLGFFCFDYYWYLLVTWLPDYLVNARHLSLQKAGIYASLPFLVFGACQPLGGWVADRLTRAGWDATRTRKGIVTVAFLTGLLLIPAARATSANTALFLIMGGCLVGLSTANQLVILQSCAPADEVGLWVGIYNFIGNLAGISAPIVTGFIVQATGSYTPAFILASVLIALGPLSYWFIVGELKEVKGSQNI